MRKYRKYNKLLNEHEWNCKDLLEWLEIGKILYSSRETIFCLPNNYFIFPSITTNVLSINRNKYKISINYIPIIGIPHRIIFLSSGSGIFYLPRDRNESRESLNPLPVAQIGYGWNPVPVGWYWCTEHPIRSSNSLQHSGVLGSFHPRIVWSFRGSVIRKVSVPHEGWGWGRAPLRFLSSPSGMILAGILLE